MGTISKRNERPHLLPGSLQLRFSITYIVFTALILLVINVYPVIASQDIVFSSKETSILQKAQVVASSLSGLESLTADGVTQVMQLLDDVNTARIVITDGEGRALYDSSTARNATGKYMLYPEIIRALGGSDVFQCSYDSGCFESRAAIPVMYRASPIGAVYVLDLDTEQAQLIYALRSNMRLLSVVIAVLVVVFSLVFSTVFSSRIRKILRSFRIVREGNYSHKITSHSHDELGMLADEFNQLTDRLQTTDQLRRQFVSDASHELKTPLASIRLLADSILQNDMDRDTTREFVQDIGDEADRLARMTIKLLTLTRIDSDVYENIEIVELSATVNKVFRMLQPLAKIQNVTLTCTMDEGCTILARQDDIYQVVFNLVENGIKYNRENGTVNVLLYRREDEVYLLVEDCGVGIPADEMQHIFERFYRVDKARSREAGGTGLGLAIVRDVVVRHHGTVSVSAREQGGTRFQVVFPFVGMDEEGGLL